MSPTPSGDHPLITASNVDLSNCDRELVQYSGAIQPHSALVSVSEPDLRILQVSANTGDLFGIPPSDILGRPSMHFSASSQTQRLRQLLVRESLKSVPPVRRRALPPVPHLRPSNRWRPGSRVGIRGRRTPRHRPIFEVHANIAGLQNTPDLQKFFDLAVQQIRHFTGFDRVMAYEFLSDGSGRVISESVAEDLETYLGLHYPASDIPQPARRLFALTWLRHLPNVDYTPVSPRPGSESRH